MYVLDSKRASDGVIFFSFPSSLKKKREKRKRGGGEEKGMGVEIVRPEWISWVYLTMSSEGESERDVIMKRAQCCPGSPNYDHSM